MFPTISKMFLYLLSSSDVISCHHCCYYPRAQPLPTSLGLNSPHCTHPSIPSLFHLHILGSFHSVTALFTAQAWIPCLWSPLPYQAPMNAFLTLFILMLGCCPGRIPHSATLSSDIYTKPHFHKAAFSLHLLWHSGYACSFMRMSLLPTLDPAVTLSF